MKTTKFFPYLILFGKITTLLVGINSLNPVLDMESSTSSNKISARDGSRYSSNELHDGPCRSVTMLFAKGTREKGNLGGGTSPGPAFSDELKKIFGKDNVAVQGIDYVARLSGFFVGGEKKGSKELVDMAIKAVSQCPDTKLVLGGYSQGAQVVHRAVKKLCSEVSSKIYAVVLFGDPFHGRGVGDLPASLILSICNSNDIICRSGAGFKGHRTYPERAKEAANFVKSKLGRKSIRKRRIVLKLRRQNGNKKNKHKKSRRFCSD